LNASGPGDSALADDLVCVLVGIIPLLQLQGSCLWITT
jgi:hypothetical protein